MKLIVAFALVLALDAVVTIFVISQAQAVVMDDWLQIEQATAGMGKQ